ncbi:hypothetical protein [Flavobacterium sp.]|uniref:hypothetical protein n=1 Tax=Flavobacterium sp. TaxID=239 RepID=UPI0025C2872F|nr:hypothetical protein [Flavobacterium sp.]
MEFSSDALEIIKRSRETVVELGDDHIWSLHFLVAIWESRKFRPNNLEVPDFELNP